MSKSHFASLELTDHKSSNTSLCNEPQIPVYNIALFNFFANESFSKSNVTSMHAFTALWRLLAWMAGSSVISLSRNIKPFACNLSCTALIAFSYEYLCVVMSCDSCTLTRDRSNGQKWIFSASFSSRPLKTSDSGFLWITSYVNKETASLFSMGPTLIILFVDISCSIPFLLDVSTILQFPKQFTTIFASSTFHTSSIMTRTL